MIAQIEQHFLQPRKRACLAKLPRGIGIAAPADTEPEETSRAPPLIYRLPREVQEPSYRVHTERSTLRLQQTRTSIKAAEARTGQGIVALQGSNGLWLFERGEEHRIIRLRPRGIAQSAFLQILSQTHQGIESAGEKRRAYGSFACL
jgi:hypothetical protein